MTTTIIDNADSVLLRATTEPFYVEMRDETELFMAAYAEQIPVLLKGPTGCGKTRFVEHMAWRLGRSPAARRRPAPGWSR